MSAPNSSFEIDSLDEKVLSLLDTDTVIIKDSEDGNLIKEVPARDLIPFAWGGSDEDSPLSTGVLYTTEVASTTRKIKDVFITVSHAPTGSDLLVEVDKETGTDTNVFATIFSSPPVIAQGKFSNVTSVMPAIPDNILEEGRRLRIRLPAPDSGGTAAGLKVEIT